MRVADADIDWNAWFERWQVQQDCYVPQRRLRFDLLLRWPELPRDAQCRVLNLGCGPGALALAATEHYPKARVVAVDWDPVLLTMGQAVAKERPGHVEFLRADLREEGWWAEYEESFDLVVSATALHWLAADDLTGMYDRVYRALKPGGWFMNSDHVASEDAETQARYRAMLQTGRGSAFRETGALTWEAFWYELGKELGQLDLGERLEEAKYWEGTDDGMPRRFHTEALRRCGFERAEVVWQCLGEAVMAAQKA